MCHQQPHYLRGVTLYSKAERRFANHFLVVSIDIGTETYEKLRRSKLPFFNGVVKWCSTQVVKGINFKALCNKARYLTEVAFTCCPMQLFQFKPVFAKCHLSAPKSNYCAASSVGFWSIVRGRGTAAWTSAAPNLTFSISQRAPQSLR